MGRTSGGTDAVRASVLRREPLRDPQIDRVLSGRVVPVDRRKAAKALVIGPAKTDASLDECKDFIIFDIKFINPLIFIIFIRAVRKFILFLIFAFQS